MELQYEKQSAQQLQATVQALGKAHKELCQKGLCLDMSRGKPGAEQLDLSEGLLSVLEKNTDCFSGSGFDCRNYGVLEGLPAMRALFAEILGVEAEQVIVGGNSSLNLMYDALARAFLYGVPGGDVPFSRLEKVKFLCPCPGYDRHFSICQSLGVEMIPIPMQADGPDLDLVERLVAEDESIKGIWCVPKYSNPQGIVYSDTVISRLANLNPCAKDFRIYWDNAYVIHSFVGENAKQVNLMKLLEANGKEDMVLMFTSTSKITYPGAGVSAIAASKRNIDQIKATMGMQTIGHDKLNQLRHLNYFGSYQGVLAHMERHAKILRPKFEIVLNTLQKELGGLGIATWTNPTGGYFVSLDVMEGCAKRVYTLAKEAGVTLTPVGATFPYGMDPKNQNLRLAPTYPSKEDLQQAMEILCLCVKLAAAEHLLSSR